MPENTLNNRSQSPLGELPLNIGSVINKNGQLERELMQKVLNRYWQRDDVKIQCHSVQPVEPLGSYFTSSLWRVEFTYYFQGKDGNDDSPKTRESVIVKTMNESEKINKMMNTKTGFINEVFAYEHVIPALSEIVGVPLRVPKMLHGNEESIVLEDMYNRNFKATMRKLAVEWSQVWSTIEEMAKLHAASIVMNCTKQEKFESLWNSIIKVPIELTELLKESLQKQLDVTMAVLDGMNKPEAKKYIPFLKKKRETAWEEQAAIIDEKNVQVKVINHTSIWMNNILFRDNMMVLLDWQHIKTTSPACDLSFYLWVNLNTDFLIDHKRKLVDYYLVCLHQFIYDSCVNIMPAPELEAILNPLTSEWINDELKRFNFYGYIMALWTTAGFYWSERDFEIFLEKGGFDAMPVREKMRHLTFDQKDRLWKLTQHYFDTNSN